MSSRFIVQHLLSTYLPDDMALNVSGLIIKLEPPTMARSLSLLRRECTA
jgi:hypothetical protein